MPQRTRAQIEAAGFSLHSVAARRFMVFERSNAPPYRVVWDSDNNEVYSGNIEHNPDQEWVDKLEILELMKEMLEVTTVLQKNRVRAKIDRLIRLTAGDIT